MAKPTEAGATFLRARLRELGRAADGALPQVIVKAPKIDTGKVALLSASEIEYREKDAATEKAALRAWHHPGIVTFFGAFISRTDHDRQHLVLEACNGTGSDGPVMPFDMDHGGPNGATRGDFWRYITTRLHPSDEAFRFIAWQLLAPVAYLHKHEVAHRDLKNENFLVSGKTTTASGVELPIVKVRRAAHKEPCAIQAAFGACEHARRDFGTLTNTSSPLCPFAPCRSPTSALRAS